MLTIRMDSDNVGGWAFLVVMVASILCHIGSYCVAVLMGVGALFAPTFLDFQLFAQQAAIFGFCALILQRTSNWMVDSLHDEEDGE